MFIHDASLDGKPVEDAGFDLRDLLVDAFGLDDVFVFVFQRGSFDCFPGNCVQHILQKFFPFHATVAVYVYFFEKLDATID